MIPDDSFGLPTRYWEKVEHEGECWAWMAYVNAKGYGKFTLNGVAQLAHRVMYAAAKGDPAGLVVDHLCHNHKCVRPEHLQLVTRTQNNEHRRGANANNASGIRGVSWVREGLSTPWRVRVKHREVTHEGGCFANLADAEAAAIALRNRLMTNNLRDRQPSA